MLPVFTDCDLHELEVHIMAAMVKEIWYGRSRNPIGLESPLGRFRCERFRGGASDLPRGRSPRISAIGRAHPRAAEDPVVSRRPAKSETLYGTADNRRGRPVGD